MPVKNQINHEKRPTTSYQKYLIKELQDPTEAIAYLNAALMDEDARIFLVALKNVLSALHSLGFNLAIQPYRHK